MYRSDPVVTEEEDCLISTAVLTHELLSVQKMSLILIVLEQILEAKKQLSVSSYTFALSKTLYLVIWTYDPTHGDQFSVVQLSFWLITEQ